MSTTHQQLFGVQCALLILYISAILYAFIAAGGVMVSLPDLQSSDHGFDSWAFRHQVTILIKLFTPMCQNFGVHTAWRKAKERDTWHQVVSTATLC